jgi:perosamine synthetase
MKDDLAIFGGNSIKKEPYNIHTTNIGDEEEQAVLKVMRTQHLSGFSARPGERFLGGPSVQSFEKALSKAFSVNYVVSVNSATSGLHCALYAAGVKNGDEVITSSFTMSATASAIAMCNATPVFCDIEDETYGIDPGKVESLITSKTKAILAVNIFGHGASLDILREIADKNNILLIEDSAQAPLINYKEKLCGLHGDIGVFSLNYHKAIQTGEGGFAITNDRDLADRMRYLRNHGEVVIGPANRLDMIDIVGYNYRMTEIESAIGEVQLKKLLDLNKVRQDLSKKLQMSLKEYEFLSGPIIKQNCDHGFYLFPIRFHKDKIGISRETFVKAMQAEGLALGFGYVLPVHLQPMYQLHMQNIYDNYQGIGIENLNKEVDYRLNLNNNVDYKLGVCPIAEKMHYEEIMTTDICKYPNSERDIEDFCDGIKKIVKSLGKLQSLEG